MKKKILALAFAVAASVISPSIGHAAEVYPISSYDTFDVSTKDMDYRGLRVSPYGYDDWSRFEIFVGSMTYKGSDTDVDPFVVLNFYDKDGKFVSSYDTRSKEGVTYTNTLSYGDEYEWWMSAAIRKSMKLSIEEMKSITYYSVEESGVIPKGNTIKCDDDLAGYTRVSGNKNITVSNGELKLLKPIRVGKHVIAVKDKFGNIKKVKVTVS